MKERFQIGFNTGGDRNTQEILENIQITLVPAMI